MTRLNTAIIACIAGLMIIASPAAARQTGEARAPRLNGLLDDALQDETVPAMGVLVIRDGAIAAQAVQGVRAADSLDPATIDDTWHIGSDAKAMTATLIARLVERGVLSWTTPLKDLLPDTSMRAEYQTVTLLDLLSHRAGLRNLDDTIDATMIETAFTDARPLPAQRLAFAATVLNEPPIGPARADTSYSNSDYVLAGAIAEHATGKAFEVLMQEEIFQPLGMHVVFAPDERGDILGHKAGVPLTGLRADNPPLFAPVGQVKVTLHDWALFAIDQMQGERGQGRLLSSTTYRLLHAPQGDTNAALGWGVRTTWPAKAPVRMISHAGSNGYSYALIALLPDRMGGVLIAANAAEGTDAEQIETNILLELLGEIATTPAEPSPQP